MLTLKGIRIGNVKKIFSGLVSAVILFSSAGVVGAADWVETFAVSPPDWTSVVIVDQFVDGAAWSVNSGNLRNGADDSASSIMYYDDAETTGWTDYSVVVPAFDDDLEEWDGATGIAFHIQNVNNFYFAVYDHNFPGDLKVGKRLGGTFSELGSVTHTYGCPAKLEVRIKGNNIKFYVNDNLEIDVTDGSNPLLFGSVGAYVNTDYLNMVTWDEFQVTFTYIDIGLRVYDVDVGIISIAAWPLGQEANSPVRVAADMDDNETPEIYGIALVDPDDPMDSGVRIRIQGSSGPEIKALRKF